MWASERRQKEGFERDGWTVIRNGWPDFLLVKEQDGKRVIRFVEIKGIYGATVQKITEAQQATHDALKSAGFEVEVLYDK